MEKNKFYQKENGKGISYILMILMSLLCVVIAGLLLFVPAIPVLFYGGFCIFQNSF